MNQKAAAGLVVAVGIALFATHDPAGQVPAGMPPPPPGFPDIGAERPVLRQFDRNGNERLDAAERKAAREWLATQPAQGFPGPTGRRGRGGPPGGPFGGGRDGGPFGGRGGFAPGSPGARLVPSDVTARPRTAFYDTDTLRTLFLRFEGNDWEEELSAFYNTDVEVPATLSVDGETYRDVGVGFRGLSSFMMVPGERSGR